MDNQTRLEWALRAEMARNTGMFNLTHEEWIALSGCLAKIYGPLILAGEAVARRISVGDQSWAWRALEGPQDPTTDELMRRDADMIRLARVYWEAFT